MATPLTTFSVAVYPLVRKFLAYHYNTEPFDITRLTNPCASYLYACLDRYDHRDTQRPKKYDRLTERLTIGMASWRVKMYGPGRISPRKMSAFNDFVRQLFFEKLTSEVSLGMALGGGLRASTQQFLDRYDISEDELPMDTALRYFARHRRRSLTRLILPPQLSPLPAGRAACLLS